LGGNTGFMVYLQTWHDLAGAKEGRRCPYAKRNFLSTPGLVCGQLKNNPQFSTAGQC
jgi:hypothetical protein